MFEPVDGNQFLDLWPAIFSKKNPRVMSKSGLQGIKHRLRFFGKMGILADKGLTTADIEWKVINYIYSKSLYLEEKFPDIFIPAAIRSCALIVEDYGLNRDRVEKLLPRNFTSTTPIEKIWGITSTLIRDCQAAFRAKWIPEVIFDLAYFPYGMLLDEDIIRLKGISGEKFVKTFSGATYNPGMILLPSPSEDLSKVWLSTRMKWRDQLDVRKNLFHKIGFELPDKSFQVGLADAWEVIFFLLSYRRGGTGAAYLRDHTFRAMFDSDIRTYWEITNRIDKQDKEYIEIREGIGIEESEARGDTSVLPIIRISSSH